LQKKLKKLLKKKFMKTKIENILAKGDGAGGVSGIVDELLEVINDWGLEMAGEDFEHAEFCSKKKDMYRKCMACIVEDIRERMQKSLRE